MTISELLKLISHYIPEPAADGTRGQVLTLGDTAPEWSGRPSQIAAATVRVSGQDYTLRTGASGAPGYITIAPDVIWLGANRMTLDLGGLGVTAIYKGTQLVYSRFASVTLFDRGWVAGVDWAGNTLPRRQYTSYGYYSFANVDSDGYMRLYVSGSTTYNHNAHVAAPAMVIPASATQMHVIARRAASAGDMVFGVISPDCPNTYDVSAGGQLSPSTTVSYLDETEYTLTLSDSVKGQTLIPVINFSGVANAVKDVRIYKVWFD